MVLILIKNRNFPFVFYTLLWTIISATAENSVDEENLNSAVRDDGGGDDRSDSFSLFPELPFGSLLITDNNIQCKKDSQLFKEHFSNFSLWAQKSKLFLVFILYVSSVHWRLMCI